MHGPGRGARSQGRFHGIGHGRHFGCGALRRQGREGGPGHRLVNGGNLLVGKGLGPQAASGGRGGGTAVALRERDALAGPIGLGELADALGVGIAVEHLGAGGGIGGHGHGVAGQQVRQVLGGAGEHLVVVHDHVGAAGGGQGRLVGQQEAHGHGRGFRLQHGARGVQHGLQQGVHVGLLAGDEPVAVAVGVFHQLGPAAVEELQHLLEATVLQAAHLHVLHDEAHLQRCGDAPGPSAEGPAGLAGQQVGGDEARAGDRDAPGGRAAGFAQAPL